MEEEIKDGIVYKAHAAHVIFSIAIDEYLPGWYKIYSESAKEGKRPLGECPSYDEALVIIEDEIQTLEKNLERKRAGMPTPKQVHFLFRNKIPIPLTLTWGEATDLIEERLAQIEIEKEAKQRILEVPYHTGDKVVHPSFGTGIVLHAGYKLAAVQFSDGKKMLDIKDISFLG